MNHTIPTIEEFRQAVADGWVREFQHNSLPLVGFVYSFKCEMEGGWNNVTRYARGIVFDSLTGELVAFPFPKFFNLNQHDETRIENLPSLPFTVTTKEDGSLIIVYNYKGQWICSTKGSFHSEQANWANAWLAKEWKRLETSFNYTGENNTWLFEGIYPTNRIVVDYGEFEGLKFLGAFNRKFHTEMTDLALPHAMELFPCADSHSLSLREIVELCTTLPGTFQEGFVLRYSNGLRVKIKGIDYCSIHRVVTNATPLSVWEGFNFYEPIYDKDFAGEKPSYLAAIPDEFLPKIIEWDAELRRQYKILLDKAQAALDNAQAQGTDRKSICIHLQKHHKDVISLAISLMDGKMDRVHASIKERIRPTANELDGERRAEVLGKK
jgi:RNA ligase